MIERRRTMGCNDAMDNAVLLYLTSNLQDKSKYNRRTIKLGNIQEDYNNECIYIDGRSDISGLRLDHNITADIGYSNYSISFDVNVQSYIQPYATILSKGGSNSVGGVLGINKNYSGVYLYANGDRIFGNNYNILNTWYHIEFIKKNSVFTLKCNNETIGTTTYGIESPIFNVVIGYNQSSQSEHFDGYIKNLIIKLI